MRTLNAVYLNRITRLYAFIGDFKFVYISIPLHRHTYNTCVLGATNLPTAQNWRLELFLACIPEIIRLEYDQKAMACYQRMLSSMCNIT